MARPRASGWEVEVSGSANRLRPARLSFSPCGRRFCRACSTRRPRELSSSLPDQHRGIHNMRVHPRLLMATPTAAGSAKGFKPAPLALLPPIPLYRRLLRAHRKHLPREMRLLGDEYIKSEFRAHRNVENPVHIVRQASRAVMEFRLTDCRLDS
jgi:hypothetical protein